MISVTRALSELKLLGKKIDQKIQELKIVELVNSTEKEVLIQEFTKSQEEKLQSVKDLIKRRNSLKSAIVLSNAKTYVEILGKRMTVAEAIERKTSIEFEKFLERQMRERFFGIKLKAENHNNQISQRADKQAESALGGETARDKGEEYAALHKAYYDRNSVKVVGITDAESEIDKLRDEIDSFENEVDFVLSESNTKTMIEV